MVTRDLVKYGKPDPDLFLAASARLGAPIETAVVVGDSIWDMLAAARCRALGVGLLCGGYQPGALQAKGCLRMNSASGVRLPVVSASKAGPPGSAPERCVASGPATPLSAGGQAHSIRNMRAPILNWAQRKCSSEWQKKMTWNATDSQRKVSSEGDILVEVANSLGKIREVAQGSRDRTLLYFIDMAIFQACKSLCSVCRPSIANELKGSPQPPARA